MVPGWAERERRIADLGRRDWLHGRRERAPTPAGSSSPRRRDGPLRGASAAAAAIHSRLVPLVARRRPVAGFRGIGALGVESPPVGRG